MKKTLSILAAAAIISAVSCEKNVATSVKDCTYEPVSIEAGIVDTKVAINGLKVNWTSSDVISICSREKGIANNKGLEFRNSLAAASANATFTGVLPDTLTCIYAIFPKNQIDHWNKGSGSPQVYINLKSSQTATKDSCDPDACVMYASAKKGETLAFKVIPAFIKFTIDASSPAVTKVVVKNGTRGTTCYNIQTPGAPVSDALQSQKDVTLSSASALAAGDYYIAVYPEEHPEGLTLTFTLSDASSFTKITPAINLNRGTVYPVGAVRKSSSTPAAFTVGEVIASGTEKGIVFEVNGNTATIMSVGTQQMHWAEVTDVTSATSASDGPANMNKIAAFIEANPSASFPAYEFCKAKGDGWYLPAKNEMMQFAAAYEGAANWDEAFAHRANIADLPESVKTARAAFDKALTDNGGVAVNPYSTTVGDAYWSSTEMTGSYTGCAQQVRMGKLYLLQGTDAAAKTKNGYVRCAKKISK